MLAFIVVAIIIYFESQLPTVNELKDVHLQIPLRIYASDGKLVAEYGGKRRIPVGLNQIPLTVINATLSTEDQRYFSHSGVDFRGLARAAFVLVLTGRKKQGGSTITMQVARNYFLSRRKTYTRKIKEILLALKIDHIFSKNKVLELYFNKIFYGNHAYGIAAAAQVYYGKQLNQLTLPQAAMLAGLPKAPSAINPIANANKALKRRNHVLWRMHDEKFITDDVYAKAVLAPITAKYHKLKIQLKAPYVTEAVRKEMRAEYGKTVYSQGLNVYTTINSRLQKAANFALFQGVMAYDKRHGYRGPEKSLGNTVPDDLTIWQKALKKIPIANGLGPAVVIAVNDQAKTATVLLQYGDETTIQWPNMRWARRQSFDKTGEELLGVRPRKPSDIVKIGDVIRVNNDKKWELSQLPQVEAALVVMNPKTGGVLAMAGGFNYSKNKFNHVIQAYRQPGSSFKPFVYSAALAKGFTLASMINDAPVVLRANSESGLWRPENDTGKFYGPTSLKQALIKSRNLVSIRLLQLIGLSYATDYVTRFGFRPNQLPHGLSLALGTAEVTPLQMVTGYAVFANSGHQVYAHLINRITDSTGKVIYKTSSPYVCNAKCQSKIHLNNINQETKALSPRPMAQQVITPQNAYLITHALQDVILYGTGRPALVLQRPDLAGKTGTTNKKKDAWFSGYNRKLVATSWMGFDSPRPLFEYGAQAALPIWIDFMRVALKGKSLANVPQPPGIVTIRINPKTGQRAIPGSKKAIFEMFREQYIPKFTSHSQNNNLYNGTSDNLEQQLY